MQQRNVLDLMQSQGAEESLPGPGAASEAPTLLSNSPQKRGGTWPRAPGAVCVRGVQQVGSRERAVCVGVVTEGSWRHHIPGPSLWAEGRRASLWSATPAALLLPSARGRGAVG